MGFLITPSLGTSIPQDRNSYPSPVSKGCYGDNDNQDTSEYLRSKYFKIIQVNIKPNYKKDAGYPKYKTRLTNMPSQVPH